MPTDTQKSLHNQKSKHTLTYAFIAVMQTHIKKCMHALGEAGQVRPLLSATAHTGGDQGFLHYKKE